MHRHPISFPIRQTSEARDLFALFSYGMFFGVASKRARLPDFPSHVRVYKSDTLHTITIDVRRTNIRIFAIPFIGILKETAI